MTNQHTNASDCGKTPEQLPGFFFPLILLFIYISISFVSCISNSPEISPDDYYSLSEIYDSHNVWQPVTTGIDRIDFNDTSIPLHWHALRINLATPDISISSWPGVKPDGKKRSVALEAQTCDVALNTLRYYKERDFFKTTTIPIGVYIHDKQQFTRKTKRYCALTLTKQEDSTFRAAIYDSQADIPDDNPPDFAFGGYWTILRDGTISPFKAYRDSRLAVGVSNDGTLLYILLVEGSKKRVSTGLTYMECAKIIQALGGTSAMQLDGGTSAQVYVQKKPLSNTKSHLQVPIILTIKTTKVSEKIDE